MSTSGTYAYSPAISNLVLIAYGRINIRRAEIVSQHMADAEQEGNLLQSEWSNRQVNLWTDELYTQTLTAGTATYSLPQRMIAIQAAYITTTVGGTSTDRIIWPLSTFEYAAQPDKTQQAPPTAYWYNRQITPQITMWQVPDSSATYTLNLRILHQIEDATIASGVTLATPYRWLDAWTAGLAARLAEIYPDAIVKAKGPGAVDSMWTKYERAWSIAAAQDVEDVPLYVIPDFSGYQRT